jgi:hypothetical protein
MASYFISAHGNLRKEGNRQTQAKFIVPANVTIYFFSPAGTALSPPYSDFLMDLLINPQFSHSDELKVQAAAFEVFREGQLCLNYTANTDGPKFRDPMGLYRIGKWDKRVPELPLPDGTSKTLQEWVTGISTGSDSGGAYGTHFYWGACRVHDFEHPSQNTRLFEELQVIAQNATGRSPQKPESYTNRYGYWKTPFEDYSKQADNPLWIQQTRVSRSNNPKTLDEAGKWRLRSLLSRLKKGEGLFGPQT